MSEITQAEQVEAIAEQVLEIAQAHCEITGDDLRECINLWVLDEVLSILDLRVGVQERIQRDLEGLEQ